MASLCNFPTFSFVFSLPLALPQLPTFDLTFSLAIPWPIACPLD